MDKLLFLHIEIKHVLDVLNFIDSDKKIELMAAIDNLPYEKLLEVLRNLYKIEREYFQILVEGSQEEKELSQ